MQILNYDIDKKYLIYAGIGAFVLLVIYASTRKVDLIEITAPTNATANFDHSSLPESLQPPERLPDNAELPIPAKRPVTLNAIGVKPRFDNNNNIF